MALPYRHLIGLGVAGSVGLTVGALAGVAAERIIINRTFRYDPDRYEPYGQLRGTVRTATTEDGVVLQVEVHEPPGWRPDTDPTVIFTHGYALNQDSWHYQRRDLESMARLVFWDQRSHGQSGRGESGTHTIDQLGRDLIAVIKSVQTGGPVILVGHSMGGMTVMSAAAQEPELFGDVVRGVGLIATSSGAMNTVSFGLPAVAAQRLHRYSGQAVEALAAQAALVDLTRRRTNDLGHLLTLVYSFGGWSSPTMTRFVAEMLNGTPTEVVAEFLPTLLAHDKTEALAAMQQVEILVMVGTNDLLTPVAHSKEIVRHLPGAELVVIPDTGHMIALERPSQVNYHLRQLIMRSVAG